jgi:hypothetical protein
VAGLGLLLLHEVGAELGAARTHPGADFMEPFQPKFTYIEKLGL